MLTESNKHRLGVLAKHIRQAVTVYTDLLALGADRDALHDAIWGEDGNGLPTLGEVEAFGEQCRKLARKNRTVEAQRTSLGGGD